LNHDHDDGHESKIIIKRRRRRTTTIQTSRFDDDDEDGIECQRASKQAAMEGERGCCDVALIRLLPRCPSHTLPPSHIIIVIVLLV